MGGKYGCLWKVLLLFDYFFSQRKLREFWNLFIVGNKTDNRYCRIIHGNNSFLCDSIPCSKRAYYLYVIKNVSVFCFLGWCSDLDYYLLLTMNLHISLIFKHQLNFISHMRYSTWTECKNKDPVVGFQVSVRNRREMYKTKMVS